MGKNIIRRLIEGMILSVIVLIVSGILLGWMYYPLFGIVAGVVLLVRNYGRFCEDNRPGLYPIVFAFDVMFWPNAIATNIIREFRV